MALRYPNAIIEENTDFFQIVVKNYEAGSLTGSGTTSATNVGTGSGGEVLDTIILPMPSNIQDGNSVSYSDDSLDTLSAKLAGAAGNLISNTNVDNSAGGFAGLPALAAENLNTELKNIFKSGGEIKTIITKTLAAQAASVFGGNVTANQLLARESGSIINPNLELLFNGVSLRSFKFSFKMTPRDSAEKDNIREIIYTLKKTMAAKSAGFFLTSPNVYELSYRKGNGEHPFLHKFKTCALTDMSVNYTGEGIYATYSDGAPISLIMDLSFKELFPIYEDNYNNAGSTVGY